MQPRRMKSTVAVLLVGAAGLLPILAAAQSPPGYAGPGFPDPKTGKIWTPDNVGQDGKPLDPSDRAFDPSGQAVVVGPPVQVLPTMSVVGKVPVTADPTVPPVEVHDLSLRTSGDGYWRAEFRLQNNSATPRAAEVVCVFKNGDKTVMQANVAVPSAGAGDRLSVSFNGPRDMVFVDGMDCRIASN